MPRLRDVELDFFDHPPAHFRNEIELPAPPERVFALLGDPPGWASWFDDMKSGAWTSAPPYGVGATRTMVLGLTTAEERILAWEPGRRFAFRIERLGVPLVRAMDEDYRLEPTPSGCTLVWFVAYEPTWLARAVHPLVRAVFGRQFRRSLEGLRRKLAGQDAA